MATAGGATELEALRREFDDYKAESAALDEELERSLATAQREAEMHKLRADRAEEALARLKSELRSASAQAEALQTRLRASEEALARQRDSLRKNEQEKDDVERQLRVAEAQLEAVQAKFEALQEDHVLLREEFQELRGAHERELAQAREAPSHRHALSTGSTGRPAAAGKRGSVLSVVAPLAAVDEEDDDEAPLQMERGASDSKAERHHSRIQGLLERSASILSAGLRSNEDVLRVAKSESAALSQHSRAVSRDLSAASAARPDGSPPRRPSVNVSPFPPAPRRPAPRRPSASSAASSSPSSSHAAESAAAPGPAGVDANGVAHGALPPLASSSSPRRGSVLSRTSRLSTEQLQEAGKLLLQSVLQ